MENLNTTIPTNTATMEDVARWYALNDELKAKKIEEMALRKRIFETYFPNAVEGTNKYELPDGFQMKGKRVISRDIDKGSLQALASSDVFTQHGINADELVEWKPALKLLAYRKLTPEQAEVFDQVLVVKDGAPSIEIILPKK